MQIKYILDKDKTTVFACIGTKDKYRKTGPYYCYKKGSALVCKHDSIGDVCIMITLNAFEDINNTLDAILAVAKESGIIYF